MEESSSQKRRNLSAGWVLKKRDSEIDPIKEFDNNEINNKENMSIEKESDGFKRPFLINNNKTNTAETKKLLPKLNNEQISELYSNCLNLSTHNVKNKAIKN